MVWEFQSDEQHCPALYFERPFRTDNGSRVGLCACLLNSALNFYALALQVRPNIYDEFPPRS